MEKINRRLTSIFKEPLFLLLFLLLPLCIDSVGMSDFAQNAGGKIIKLTSAAPFLFLLFILFWFWATAPRNRYRLGLSTMDTLYVLILAYAGQIAGGQIYGIYLTGNLIASFTAAYTFLSMAALFVIVRTNNFDPKSRDTFVTVLLGSFVLLALANFALFAAGIEGGRAISSLDDATNKTLMLIGIPYHRVQFPWVSGGLNGYTVICLILFFMGGAAFIGKGTRLSQKVLGFLAGTLAVIGFILVDSRGSLLALFLSVIVTPITLRFRMTQIGWPFLLLLIQLSPLAIILVAPYLAHTELFTLLDRGHFTDPAAALTTGRSYIWQAAWENISEHPMNYLIGAGHFGHLVSGMSAKYAFIFPGEGPFNTHTTHNALLQTLVDRGIIGVIFYCLVIYITVRNLYRKWNASEPGSPSRWGFMGLLGAINAICIMGQTEAVLTQYFPVSIYFLLICAAVGLDPAPASRRMKAPTHEYRPA